MMNNCFGATTFLLDSSDIAQVLIRLILAFFSGAIIGVNRELKRRGAGIRTHSLVCTSAALIMMTGEFLYHCYGSGDVARLGAQVISGVGFLGAGTIMVTGRNKVKGLTTAATIWTSACIGLAIGSGFLFGALAAVVLVMINLIAVNRLDDYIESHSKIMELYIEFGNPSAMSEFISAVHERNAALSITKMNKAKVNTDSIAVMATINLQNLEQYQEMLQLVGSIEGILYYDKI